MKGHPETDIYVYAFRCITFQAVVTSWFMAQLAHDMLASRACSGLSSVPFPRVATVKNTPLWRRGSAP